MRLGAVRALARGLPLLLLVGASSCLLGIGDCNYDHRSIELAGTLAPTPGTDGQASVTARVALNETRGADPDFRTMSVELTGVLAGVPGRIELVDAQGGAVLAVFSGNFSGWYATVDLGPTPTQETLADLADDGRLRLLVTRDGAAAPMLAGTLSVTDQTDWDPPRCD